MTDALTFDCFLSHNSRDKPAVRALVETLRGRGISVWLDEEQLRPGLPWQDEVELGIRASQSVAVLVGADGLGPWERREMRAALTLAVDDGRPVIPVLLADAPQAPALPMFLRDRTWVDLRTCVGADGSAGIDRLVFGITGRRVDRPTADPPPPSPPIAPVTRQVSTWARPGPWAVGLAAVASAAWFWPHGPGPGPGLVNHPTSGWISEWTGELAGLDGGADTPVAVRLRIEAERSYLELVRRDRVTCTTPVAVVVADRGAGISSPGPVACPDGRALGEWVLICQEASGGGADCTGRHASGRPPLDRTIHVALARVGGGAWSVPVAASATPVEPASPAAATPSQPAAPAAAPAPVASPAATPAGAAAMPLSTEAPPSGPPTVISDPLKSGGQGPEMIALRAGCFMMGSPPDEPERAANEGPQHSVCVDAFAIGRTEVTFAQYDRFAAATRRRMPEDAGWGRGDRPVINVSWDDAVAYTEWLSGETGHSYRLPTEAEWEYAARAGTTGPFWSGDCIHTDQANYDGRYDYADCGAKTGLYRGQTVPAGSLPPNPWGLHEVAGNVWEWCLDGYSEDFYARCQAQGQVANPLAPAAGGSPRVLRGGSFALGAWFLRASIRVRNEPEFRYGGWGFRCVLAAPRQPFPSTH